MKQEELNKVLELHKKWLRSEYGGVRADLTGADLKGACLSFSTLRGADLTGACLTGADLNGTDLYGTNLSGVNLYATDLRGVNLSGADLRGADLTGADLYGADLNGTDLYGTNLRYSKNYYSFTAYDTSKRIVHCVRHSDTWSIQAGCFWGTLEELEAKVKNTHNSKVYLANIKILKGLK